MLSTNVVISLLRVEVGGGGGGGGVAERWSFCVVWGVGVQGGI